VVIGGSFIGLETAATLKALGLDVTLIEREPALFASLCTPLLSEYFRRQCTERGIHVRLDCGIARFEGDGELQAIVTDRGETVRCDLAVVGIGVAPNCEFLAGSGIELDNGVVVDECLQSSDPDVFAAGDVARFQDTVFGVRRRIEHWDNAIRQGRLAAKNMVGQRLPYSDVSVFYGELFGLAYNFMGLPDGADEKITRGELDRHSFSLLYLHHEVLRAAFSVGRSAEEASACEQLIRNRTSLHACRAHLGSDRFLLDKIPSQTVLILQGGGALGAFECGAVAALEEHGVHPDVVAAVSIGAFNAAIIASHPGRASRPLAAFWRDLSISLPNVNGKSWFNPSLAWYVTWFGVQNFFKPRWWNPAIGIESLMPWWTSLYDPSPVLAVIRRYVDFEGLATSPVRLLISAVDVKTGALKVFDSYSERLTPEHLLASGSLPPALPWTLIDGRPYWDGGIVSNSPLEMVIERCGSIGKRVFVVDLFSGEKAMPSNLAEVMLRRDEIVYTDRVQNDLRFEEYANDFGDLVRDILRSVDPAAAQRICQKPQYIRLMGNRAPITISRIALREVDGQSFMRDFDFSDARVSELQHAGYRSALEALARTRRH
jgi:predicted acylesterase/phospholipase RssA